MIRMTTIAAALLLAAPLAAQDGSEPTAARTPENAQRFLNVMAEQYPITLDPKTFNFSSHQWLLQYKPARIVAEDRCVTRFEGDVNRFYAMNANSQYVGGNLDADPANNARYLTENPDLVERHKIKVAPYVVDWSKVTYLGPMHSEPYLQDKKAWTELEGTIAITAGDVSFSIYPPSKELAGRMMLAMQTLKQACDKTEGLGF